MKPVCLAAVMILAALPGIAQEAPKPPQTPPLEGNVALWRCVLPGGTYQVALNSIVSVSIHEYVVDGAARVTEVNIDTVGNSTARFYYLEPITATSPLGVGQAMLDKIQDIAKEATERTGTDDTWKKVVKNYPTTTHARTIEYRLSSKEELNKLFSSAETAFRLSRPGSFKLK